MGDPADRNRDLDALIEASSLGTPQARRLRNSVSRDAAKAIVARAFPADSDREQDDRDEQPSD